MVKHAADEEQPLLTAAERVELAFARVTWGRTFTADQSGKSVAVGMRVTPHPPHRSRRAGLPHRALGPGNDAEADQRIGMADTGKRNPSGNQALHPRPDQVVLVAPPSEYFHLQLAYLLAEDADGWAVHGHPIIPHMARHHRPQIGPLIPARIVHPQA